MFFNLRMHLSRANKVVLNSVGARREDRFHDDCLRLSERNVRKKNKREDSVILKLSSETVKGEEKNLKSIMSSFITFNFTGNSSR